MESNLTPEYIEFVDGDERNTKLLLQQLIDRAQYLPGFLGKLKALIDEVDDPFEEVPVEVPDDPAIMTEATGTIMEKRLKPAYCKP